jgi:hypothetical protein
VAIVCTRVSPREIVIEVRGPLTTDEQTRLGAHLRALLAGDPPTTVVCVLRDSDLGVVELVSALRLHARRTGGRLLVRGDRGLVELCGLGEVLEG